MTGAIDTVLEIDTPEHLAFRTRIAGPGRRMFAWLIDLVLGAVILFVLFFLLGTVAAIGAEGLGQGLTFLVLFVYNWFYFTIWEMVSGGRSAGKIALKLRVVRPDGLPITWRESILRNFLRAADIALVPASPPLLLFFGPVVMALDGEFRRLGDMVAGTIVVVEEASRMSQETAVGASPDILEDLPGRLPLDRDDLEALELFVNREHVSPARREELAEIVAELYADRLNLDKPRDPTAFLGSLWARAQDGGQRGKL